MWKKQFTKSILILLQILRKGEIRIINIFTLYEEKNMKRYKTNEIDQLVEILKNDGIISVPTDTVYGLCAKFDSKIAYNKLIKYFSSVKKKECSRVCYKWKKHNCYKNGNIKCA